MSEAGALGNLFAWSLQAGVLVGAVAVMSHVARIDVPGVRYALWRLVLAACLALPLLQRPVPVDAGVRSAVTTDVSMLTTVSGGLAVPDDEGQASPIAALALWLMAAGAVVRLSWLAVSLLRLRRLRAAGAIVSDAAYDELQRDLGTAADVRRVPGGGQPVTFGVRRPIVLLPEALALQPPGIQRAVLAHELLHVQRRDWAWFVGEEVVRAILWFNPAVWWLISRIQLAREELIDHLTVLATGSRRTYLDALIGFAEAPPATPSMPTAAAFARRSQLFRRMLLISREVTMPASRVVFSSAVTLMVVASGSWYAMAAFPLRAGAPPAAATPAAAVAQGAGSQAEPPARPVTPENPIPRRLRGAAATYPAELRGSRISAAVELRVTVDATGGVSSARRGATAVAAAGSALPTGDARDLFLKSATEAVQQWVYEPPVEAPLAFYVAFTYPADQDAAVSQSAAPQGVVALDGQARTARPAI